MIRLQQLLAQLIPVAILVFAYPAWPGERYEFYNGARMLGMGGAGVATVNDETSLLVNPAALGKLRDYFITIADPEISIGEATQGVIGYDVMAPLNPQTALDKLNLNKDLHLHERAQIFPSIVVPNFGFGILGKYEVNAKVDSETNKFLYDYTNDYAMAFGFNLRMWGGIIKIGANARIINRVEVRRDDIDPTSTTLSLNDLAASGVGVGSDVGLIIAAPYVWLPTLSAVVRDVGNTTYSLRDGMTLSTQQDPEMTKQTIDAGFAVFPIVGKRSRMSWTVEYRDVMNSQEDTRVMRRLHGGAEINFADALFLRAGANQGFWTAGLELAMSNYQLQLAAYGEDIGTSAKAVEDRRYLFKFAFRF